jgi:hypothetical protein
MEEKTKTTIGYKGFTSELQCNGFQYKVGKKYHSDKADLCKVGFHFCLNPLDVFSYYDPASSRFCIVKTSGVSSKTSGDSKRVCTDIEIMREITLLELIGTGVDFIKRGVTDTQTNTGYRSAATNTGNRSAATNTGDLSAATNTGNQSAATNTGDLSAATNTGNLSAATNTGNQSVATVSGKDAVAIATGRDSKAKGSLGCGIVVVERGEWDGKTYPLKAIKAAIVDGKKIKADTFYTLKDGKFVEVK